MPQQIGNTNQKKKKKGRAPAHQNKFAYKHNPKSKTTEKILASPIYHVCQRCHDKLEWRKQYRKYKPRTQPGTCNGCKRRNVKAAYHTICENCTINSIKAQELINVEIESIKAKVKTKKQKQAGKKTSGDDDESLSNRNKEQQDEVESEDDEIDLPKFRACAVCVKELALPDDEDGDDEENELALAAGRMKLRDLKTLERQIEREEAEAAEADSEEAEHEDAEPDKDGDEVDKGEEDDEQEGRVIDDDEDDPFLQAIGGADKLLTGDAYRARLLAEQQQ